MPLRLIRFLVVALAIALPFQGMAAVTAGQCMALGHESDTAGDIGDGNAQGGHDHAAHTHADDGTDDVAPDGADGNGSHCCAPVSIAGPAALSILSGASNAPYVFSQFAPPGVQLDGLDRPPLAL